VFLTYNNIFQSVSNIQNRNILLVYVGLCGYERFTTTISVCSFVSVLVSRMLDVCQYECRMMRVYLVVKCVTTGST